MNFLQITSDGIFVDVVYNVYGDGVKYPHNARFRAKDIKHIFKYGNYISVMVSDEREWYMVAEPTDYYVIVESVNSTPPTDLNHLYELLKGLMI